MDERVRFIAACSEADEQRIPFSEICRRFGISRACGYKWLERYAKHGVDGLKDAPPIAGSIPHRTKPELVAKIVKLRKEHPTWGPKKLRSTLKTAEPKEAWPATSTIGELLKSAGLIRPPKRKVLTPPGAPILPPGASPNDLWCIDFKGHFRLGDGQRCYPLTLTDAASRYILKCEGFLRPTEELVRAEMEKAFREFGLPKAIRSDNGVPFASVAVGGLTALSAWWVRLGIRVERIEPGHPEQNGRHERMHRTLKAEATQPPSADLVAQQLRFDRFRHEFNDLRPHEALGLKPPARVYGPSHRAMPDELGHPEYGDWDVRWTSSDGRMRWRSGHISCGSALATTRIGLKQVSESTWEAYFGPVLLGTLDEREAKPQLRRPTSTQMRERALPSPVSVTKLPDSDVE